MLLVFILACCLLPLTQAQVTPKNEIAIIYSSVLKEAFDLVLKSINQSFAQESSLQNVQIVGYPLEDPDNTYLAMLYVHSKLLGRDKRVVLLLSIVDCHATEMISSVANKLGIIHHYVPYHKCTYRVPIRHFTANQFYLGLDNITDHISRTAPYHGGNNTKALKETDMTTMTTHLAGSLTNLMKACYDMIIELNWINFHIVYDNGYPQTDILELVNRFSSVRKGPNNDAIDITTSKILGTDDINKHIEDTVKSQPNYTTVGYRRLLVLCSEVHCQQFVTQAKNRGVLTVKVNWIFVNPMNNVDDSLIKAHEGPDNVHSATLSYFSQTGWTCGPYCNQKSLPWLQNVTATYKDQPALATTLLYLIDILLEVKQWLVKNQAQLLWTSAVESSGGFGENLSYNHLLDETEPKILLSLSDAISNATIRRPLLIYATDTYNKQTSIKEMGKWNALTPFSLLPTNYTYVNINMKNVTLRFCTANEEPFLVARRINGTDEYGNPAYTYSGFLMKLIDTLSQKIGFRYTIYHAKDGTGGGKNSNTQQWNGIIGELVAKRADVGLMMFVITKERDEAVDFTVPIAEYSADVAIKQSKDVNNLSQLLLFANPFGWDLWAFIFAFTIITAILLHFLQLAHTKLEIAQMNTQKSIRALTKGQSEIENAQENREEENKEDVQSENLSVVESIWYTYSAYWGGVPSDWVAHCLPARIITVVWWFFGLILLSSYTANLAASLTTGRMSERINSLADLAAQTSIAYGTTRSSFLSAFFEKEINPPYSAIWRGMQQNLTSSLVANTREGIEKTNNEKYAFIFGRMALKYFTEEYCEITLLNKPFNQRSYAIALQKGSPYTDILSVEILKLQENGQIEDWLQTSNLRSFIKPPREIKACPNRTDVGDASIQEAQIDFLEMLGIFYVLLIGMVVSLLIVVFELCYTRYQYVKGRKRKMTQAASASPDNELTVKNPQMEEAEQKLPDANEEKPY